jgi:hypothetical protein
MKLRCCKADLQCCLPEHVIFSSVLEWPLLLAHKEAWAAWILLEHGGKARSFFGSSKEDNVNMAFF